MSLEAQLDRLTLAGAKAMLDNKDATSVELVDACVARAERLDPKLNLFITRTFDQARAKAADADARRARGGELPALLGLPIGLKDILCTKGVRTSAASAILENFVPPYSATCVKKLCCANHGAGAISVGKLNQDEFAMGSSGENSHFGPTRNPHDVTRVPGGSSSGSAAAVASSAVLAALGTDTGGSIRQPASHCGIVGIKPTYGRVSRWGVVAYASSLDQVGPMTRTVEDAALMLGAICGHDEKDSTSLPDAVPDFTTALTGDIRGLRLGVPREYFGEGLAPDVEHAVCAAIDTAKKLGAEIVDIDLPHTRYAVATYYLVAPAECSSNLARYDGVRYGLRAPATDLLEMYTKSRTAGFGPEVRRRIMLGVFALSSGYYDAYYGRACQVRTLIREDFSRAFEHVDLIVSPTAPETAFKIGERADDPLRMYLSDILNIPVNLAGLPGMSIPCGADDAGLPVGLQIIGRPMDEATMLRFGDAMEKALPPRIVPNHAKLAGT
ncbi:MAG: Asp-tRNA(Asn)/Glu-tRNA(Gln) amidotransferase subunit GatA [Deltaproteobacteria bacterium]|nr:Asp-tRNA(Asn)/Glu-tRNA(Gln) amidotransferase subunit GatA [Deltaproteobacteria bacterium]